MASVPAQSDEYVVANDVNHDVTTSSGAAVDTPTDALVVTTSGKGKARVNALRGRNFLNHQQRLEIIKKKEEEPRWTQVQLARWAMVHFNLPKEPSQATIAVLLKKRDALKAATVRPQTRTIRPPRHPELEAALLLWVRFLQSKRVPFTGESIRLKAAQLAAQIGVPTNLNFSTGWMTGFVARHNLQLPRAHKKKQIEADDEPLRGMLRNYEPRDVFAMGESLLIYNDLPLPNEHANPDRDRVCVGLAVNIDCSEKIEPVVVTTSQRRGSTAMSGTYYNVDGSMTARIFEQWLYKLNQRMATAQRKILLLVDSAPSHFPEQLSNIRLVLLSSKVAHRVQPVDVGIMKAFKSLYRKAHLSFAVDQAEEGRPRIFDVSLQRAVHWIKQAWYDLSPELIRQCWARTGLIATREPMLPADVIDIQPEVVQSLVVSLSQLQLLETVSIDALLNPRSEDNPHYVYDDATVLRIVADESSADVETVTPEAHDVALATTGDEHMEIVDLQRPEPMDKEPTIEELLANYRGVIWSLDTEADRSEEHINVLRYLRRKQATLRHQLQQQKPPSVGPTLSSIATAPVPVASELLHVPPRQPADHPQPSMIGIEEASSA